MNRCKYTESEFIHAVATSLSIADVCRTLGLKPVGGNYKTIHSKVKKYNLDISHFTGSGWNVGDNYRPIMPPRPMEELLVISDNPMKSHALKRRLLNSEIKEAKCERCDRDKWMNMPIPLELHHINGNHCDNRLDNLLILCANCHAQTNNYRGRKTKPDSNHRQYKNLSNTCVDCGAKILNRSQRCVSCHRIKSRKVTNRPSVDELIAKVNEIGYCAVGRMYGVSDSAIRKWIKIADVV